MKTDRYGVTHGTPTAKSRLTARHALYCNRATKGVLKRTVPAWEEGEDEMWGKTIERCMRNE